jgi:hypothetical protein
MPTTIKNAICSAARWGSMPAPEQALYSGYYTTITAWEAACPADLVTADQIWEGHLYPDGPGANGEWSYAGGWNIGGVTADSTRYMHLRPAEGHGFYDHANKLTNALRYNPANGVACYATDTYGSIFTLNDFHRITGLQLRSQVRNGVLTPGTSLTTRVDKCIIWHSQTTGGYFPGAIHCIDMNRRLRISNSLIYASNRPPLSVSRYTSAGGGPVVENCTIISSAALNADSSATNQIVFKNCLVLGISNSTGVHSSSSYNGTSQSSFGGTNNQLSLTSSN